MKDYRFRIHYTTPTGRKNTTEVTVNGPNLTVARAKARKDFLARKNTSTYVYAAVYVVTEVEVLPEVAPRPRYAPGDALTLRRGERPGPVVVLGSVTDTRGNERVIIEDRNGAIASKIPEDLDRLQQPFEIVDYVIVYPDGQIYESALPYRTSSYGLDQLIQVRRTRVDGRIIKKEIVQ